MARLSDIAAVTGGRLVGADADFVGAVIDSRKCGAGELFVALPGAQSDGHDFVVAAAAAGAAGALVTRQQDCEFSQVVVEDALEALQQYAAVHRQEYAGPVIGVTGTNGKTSTKEILAAVLARGLGDNANVLYTQGNLNNHIGVPLTLLSLTDDHAAAVIEMGANHAGEIAMLAAIARPQVGIITLAGAGHLEGFGSVEGVAHAKGELFSALPESGVAIINADDEYAGLWRELASQCRQLSFGLSVDADVRADGLRQEQAGQSFTLHSPVGKAAVNLPLSGQHNVMNALAAAAAALAVGLSVEQIADGLAQANSVGGRLQTLAGPDGAKIVDDSYNANPTSVQAALDWLGEQPGRRWVVLGEMAELGAESVQWHGQVGQWARDAGIDRLFTLGALAAQASKEFGEGAVHCDSHAEIAERLEHMFSMQPASDVTLLVKGSRSMHMERIVQALTQAQGATSTAQAANGR